MAIALLPSEIARLILGYLIEEDLKSTAEQFLDECKYLEECRAYYKRGLNIPKTIHGKTLLDYLFYNPKGTIKINLDVKETQTDLIDWNSYLSQINSLNTKKSKKIADQQQETISHHSEINEVIYLGNKRPASTQHQNSDISNQTSESTPSKKTRILIGKNVEKVPELSCSTLERQLGLIIKDASNYLKEQEEQEKQNIELNKNNNINTNSFGNKFPEGYFATPTRLTDLTTIQTINQPIIVDCGKFNSPSKLVPQQIPILNGIPILYNNTSTKMVPAAIPIRPIQSQEIVNGKIKIDRVVRTQPNILSSSVAMKKIKEASDEELKRKKEMFKDLQRVKRGPKKSDEPKKKRTVFNRITPTIKQMMDNSFATDIVATEVSVDQLSKVGKISQMTDLSNNLNTNVDSNVISNTDITSKIVGDAHAELLDLLGLTEGKNVQSSRQFEKENLIKENSINGEEHVRSEFDEWFDAITIKEKEDAEKGDPKCGLENVNLTGKTLNASANNVVERRLRSRTISQRKL